jgi:hypothetical protein
MHRRGEEADVAGELLAQAADALEQLAVLALVHHRDQAVAHLEAEHIHRGHVGPARLLALGGTTGAAAGASSSALRLRPPRQAR